MPQLTSQQFAEEYADRLRSLEEYSPANLFLPGGETANIGTHFREVINNVRGDGGNYTQQKLFADRFLNDYFPRVQQLAQEANLPNISQELDSFFSKTGLPDGRLRDRYGFNLQDAKHEIVSHLRPYNAGFMPDYRTLDTGISGLKFNANPVSPLNEKFAVLLDGIIADKGHSREHLAKQGISPHFVKERLFTPSGFENDLKGYIGKQAIGKGLSETDAEAAAKNFIENIYTPKQTEISDSVAAEITDQLNKKYLPQAQYNYASMGELMYPTGGNFNTYMDNRDVFQSRLRASFIPELQDFGTKLSNPGIGYMGVATLPLAGKLLSVLGPVGDTLDVAEGASTALDSKQDKSLRIAGGVQAVGGGYGLAGLAAPALGFGTLPFAAPVAAAAFVVPEGIKAGKRITDPVIRAEDSATFTSAMPSASTKGFNRNEPLPPGKGIAILNGKPILVDKGSVAGNKTVGRPWWDAGQYFGK